MAKADARHLPLADNSVQCCVTSPPYWGLRKYAGEQELVWGGADGCEHEWGAEIKRAITGGTNSSTLGPKSGGHGMTDAAQLRSIERSKYQASQGALCRCGAWRGAYGLEPTIDMYVAHTVEILREIRRVLRPDGVLFLNLGDSYASGGKNPSQSLSEKRAPACGNDGRELPSLKVSGCACSCHDDERSIASSRRTADIDQQSAPISARPYKKDRGNGRLDSAQEPVADAPHGVQASNMQDASVSSPLIQDVQGSSYFPPSPETSVCEFCGCAQTDWRLDRNHTGQNALPSAGRTLGKYPYDEAYHSIARLKAKDMCLIPQRVAIAAQNDGWYVRSMIVWNKLNPMPESVTDRPTDAYEHIVMLTKSATYYWDAYAVREKSTSTPQTRDRNAEGYNAALGDGRPLFSPGARTYGEDGGRNIRNVWQFATQAFAGQHFATFPEELPRRCILAATSAKGACIQCGAPWERVTHLEPIPMGCFTKTSNPDDGLVNSQRQGGVRVGSGQKVQDFRDANPAQTIGWMPTCRCRGQHGRTSPCIVLDPFGGSGTTGRVAIQLRRRAFLFDLAYGGEYSPLATARTSEVQTEMYA